MPTLGAQPPHGREGGASSEAVDNASRSTDQRRFLDHHESHHAQPVFRYHGRPRSMEVHTKVACGTAPSGCFAMALPSLVVARCSVEMGLIEVMRGTPGVELTAMLAEEYHSARKLVG